MNKSIVICGNSLTDGGLQRTMGTASLAMAELGYGPVLLLQSTEQVDFSHAGRLLPADIALPEVRKELSRACLIFDYGWHDFAAQEKRARFHRYLAVHHADRVVPTAHNTSTIGRYLDMYRDLGLLRRVPGILCVSRAVRASAEARYGPLPNARVLNNAISPEFMEQARGPLTNPHPRPYFLFVGRSSSVEHKGMDHLLRAWSASGLGGTHDLVCLGGSAFSGEMTALIEREGVSSSVLHRPFTRNPAPWMRHAAALVLASRHEGLGLVLPESLYLGTPCVATRCGGPEEVIQDGVNGFLLDVGDTRGFAEAMVRMAREPGLRARLAEHAPASVEPFLFSAHTRAWERLLDGLNARGKQNSSPAISVQLPVFNKIKYLRKCLDSITAQTFTDFEAVCVDDGSTDGSWELLREHAARDPRFRVFRHAVNSGTLAARKRCFQEARGGYMAFMDADDFAYPEWLQKLLEAARREEADFVQCAAEVRDAEKKLPGEVLERYKKYYEPDGPVTLRGEDVFLGSGSPVKYNFWVSLVARPLYSAILPYIPDEPVPHGNDNLLIFMMTFFARKFVSIPDRLYCYCANGTSANLANPNPETTLEHIRSRSRIVHIAGDFLSRADPDAILPAIPLERFEQRCRLYTQSLIRRCLEQHPDSRETLEKAFSEYFADARAAVSQTAASAETPFSAFLPKSPEKSFPGRLRELALRLWATPKIQRGGLFFAEWYFERSPDVKAAGADPLKHFLRHGGREGRNPNPLFDSKWYLSVNPDVAASGVNPLVHYLRHGWREGRSPSPQFSVAEYLRRRPDVAKAGIEPLGHYLLHGVAEGVLFPVPKVPHRTAPPAAPRQEPSASPKNVVSPTSVPATPRSRPTPANPALPFLKLTTVRELEDWYARYPDFIALRETMQGFPEKDYLNANLKLIQDLAIVDFLTRTLRPGAKILEIGGGDSRVLTYFKDTHECWNLDKFECLGNGPKQIPDAPYRIVPDYIGAFSNELPSGCFDVVFSISVFEHIQGDAATLNAVTDDINRLLKHDGVQMHCMDCRFPPNHPHDLPKQRPLINHVLVQHGFTAQYVYDHCKDAGVFTISAQAYDRFWKKACGNRPHELDGLPFNIFLAAGRTPQAPSSQAPASVAGANGRRCTICGSNTFKPAWAGRLNKGVPPTCTQCLSSERHRVLRRAFEDLPPAWFAEAALLQFSEDPAVPAEQFEKVEISTYNGKNHLDIQAVDRPDASYDWVVCNHVLEHVPDDRKAMRELLRIIKPGGMLVFSYPSPLAREKTDDWGRPDDARAGHYRDYGRDAVATRFADAFAGWHVFSYTNTDPVTETPDICYFATCEPEKWNELQTRPHWNTEKKL